MDYGGNSAFGGDFFHQEDDYTRSADLSAVSGALIGGFPNQFLADSKTKHLVPHADVLVRDAGASPSVAQIVAEASHEWFDAGSLAPPLPTDPFFHLEHTTVFLSGGSAACIGNLLLSCLDVEATATVVKVSPVKFAIKAKFECQRFNCEMKVRVYRQGECHAVEFQRREGDVFLFTAFFDHAALCLKARTPSGNGLRAVSHLRVHASSSCGLHVGEGAAKTELVMLPLLRFGMDGPRFGFPSEALSGLRPASNQQILESDTERDFWGPLAITVAE